MEEWAHSGIQASESEKERAFTFAASGYCAVLARWIRSGMREDVEVVAKSITDMSKGAFQAAFEE
ncbi:TetR-like C-terminal domain-containing protein [Adlercreutzia sp. ZJ473]|uniref:TetR-like C-terminal domain-containing protein n=1 Tax=Adlercreutzia sp. ZJ473 TaxID=2722822 RepID=UPI001556748C